MNSNGRARASDPLTSHIGAVAVAKRLGPQQSRILIAFLKHQGARRGLSSEEAGELTGLALQPRCCYWRRVTELVEYGFVAPTSVRRISSAGSPGQVYVLTQAGLRRAMELQADGWTPLGRARRER